MAAAGITLGTFLQLFLSTTILGYSFGPDRCDVPADTKNADCGYYGIKQLECIQRGCCWKPCDNCPSTTPWCIKSREMYREECAQKPESKKNCGYYGIQREECLRKGCCWTPSDIPNDAWCYYESTPAVPPTAPPIVQPTVPTSTPEEGSLRIYGGTTGQLQIFHNGNWGTICDDSFGSSAAQVACRQMGLDVAYARLLPGRIPLEDAGEIMLDQVSCKGMETDILSCQNDGWMNTDCVHEEDVILSCEPYTQELRLSSNGRLEVFYNNEWGKVCDDDFTIREARVACRQLGYSDVSDVTILTDQAGEPLPKFLLDNVNCPNDGSNLYLCEHNTWGEHDCSDSEAVYLSCTGDTDGSGDGGSTGSGGSEDGSLRLVGPQAPVRGRLEIYHNGQWGTICDDNFSLTSAKVACKQLGYNTRAAKGQSIQDNEDLGPILLDEVWCNADDKTLLDCLHEDWFNHDCSHNEDVHIDCNASMLVRLTHNRLEVNRYGTWGTVCDDGFSNREAKIACRHMGMNPDGARTLPTPESVPCGAPSDIFMDNVECPDDAGSLLECSDAGWGLSDCNHREDVYIQCGEDEDVSIEASGSGGTDLEGSGSGGTDLEGSGSGGTDLEASGDTDLEASGADGEGTTPESVLPADGSLRIVGLHAPVRGRLEIYHSGEWGTICDDSFRIRSAQLACNQLGFNTTAALYSSDHTSEDIGPIMLDEVQCFEEEENFADCRNAGWFNHDCSHLEDVHIDCDAHMEVRLIQNRLEVNRFGTWGTVCDDAVTLREVKVACRHMKMNPEGAKLLPTPLPAPADVPSNIFIDQLQCPDDAENLLKCNHDAWAITDCSHGEDVYIECGEDQEVAIEVTTPESVSATEDTTLESVSPTEDTTPESVSPTEGSVRLVGPEAPIRGRLEIYHNGEWGTICDDNFTPLSASVACRQLGYNSIATLEQSKEGDGDLGPILLDEVRCNEGDETIANCRSQGWSNHDCSHGEDVHIDCDAHLQVRLNHNRLEVNRYGLWGTVCDDEFTIREAEVACRHMGMNSDGAKILTNPPSFAGDIPAHVLLDDLSCPVNATNLLECSHVGWGASDCSHSEDIYLECGEYEGVAIEGTIIPGSMSPTEDTTQESVSPTEEQDSISSESDEYSGSGHEFSGYDDEVYSSYMRHNRNAESHGEWEDIEKELREIDAAWSR